jgi:high-affinity iron transporter
MMHLLTSQPGWQIFNAILGWNNTATQGTILAYVFYWLVIVVTLIYLKWSEGRFSIFGFKSEVAKQREMNRIEKATSRAGSGSGSDEPETPGMDSKKGYGLEGDDEARRDVPVLLDN